MKKKLLSVILTAAMLLTLASTLGVAVAAEEPTQSGTVYEVTDAASITALIADTTKNVAGNTMKLTQDLTYDPTGNDGPGVWDGCKMHVDGNGHKVILKDGVYFAAILFAIDATATTQIIKNLAVVMENDDAVAKRATSEYISLFGQASAGTHTKATFDNTHLIVENCYFDVNFEVTNNSSSNVGAAVLVARVQGAAKLEITTKNTYFKATLNTGDGVGRVGALYGRRWGENILAPVKINVENCGFEVTTNNKAAKSALVGNVRLQQATTITATGTNLIYNDAALVDTITPAYECEGFTTVVNELELETADWKATTTGYPYPAALETSFGTLFADKALDGITVTITNPSAGGNTTPGGTTTPGGNQTPDNTETQAPETNAPETNAPETNATTTAAPAEEESGCASVVGGAAVVMIAMAAAFVCKKKD